MLVFHPHFLMKSILLTVAAIILCAGAAQAQKGGKGNTNNNNNNNNGNNSSQVTNLRWWVAQFPNGNNYMVRMDKIASASKHEFIANATVRVVEVTVATDSAVVARFYFMEPAGKDSSLAAVTTPLERAQSTLQDGVSRVSPTLGKQHVVKDYPTTTHAHTVDYVVQQEDTLNSLYASLTAAINQGVGGSWTSPEQ